MALAGAAYMRTDGVIRGWQPPAEIDLKAGRVVLWGLTGSGMSEAPWVHTGLATVQPGQCR